MDAPQARPHQGFTGLNAISLPRHLHCCVPDDIQVCAQRSRLRASSLITLFKTAFISFYPCSFSFFFLILSYHLKFARARACVCV